MMIDLSGDKIPARRSNPYSFEVEYRGGLVYARYGYRCVIDFPWERHPTTGTYALNGSTWVNDAVVYMKRTYPILDANREIVTPGIWSDVLYGTPPENTALVHVFRIASTILVNDARVVVQEHIGNISVIDWGNC